MRTITIFALACLTAPQALLAQTVYTAPSGYVTVTCQSNSDTIISVPLALPSVYVGTTTTPVDNGNGTHSLTLSQNPTLGQTTADSYYVKFLGGTHDGEYYEIVNKSLGAVIVVDDRDVDLTNVANGASVEVVPFWTFVKLFPIGNSTIVSSLNNFPNNRKTSVLLPTTVPGSINLAPQETYFINSTTANWRSTASGFPVSNDVILWPDSYIVVRHDSTSGPTSYINNGQVTGSNSEMPLFTHSTNQTDNFVSIPRPVDVTIDKLGLGSSAGPSSAFVASTGNFPNQRGDTLLVYNNLEQLVNKVPVSTYFFRSTDNTWRSTASGFPLANSDTISGAVGFIIRKNATVGGVTAFWSNPPSW